MLFDAAIAHLLERKVLLPAAGTLAELVAGVREAAAHRLWTLLKGLTTPKGNAAAGAGLSGHVALSYEQVSPTLAGSCCSRCS